MLVVTKNICNMSYILMFYFSVITPNQIELVGLIAALWNAFTVTINEVHQTLNTWYSPYSEMLMCYGTGRFTIKPCQWTLWSANINVLKLFSVALCTLECVKLYFHFHDVVHKLRDNLTVLWDTFVSYSMGRMEVVGIWKQRGKANIWIYIIKC
jgi:hypothetical protein